MCIIAAIPRGVKLSRDILRNCFINNPDGAGGAARHPDPAVRELVIKKGIFDFEELWEWYSSVAGQEVLIHCRVASPSMPVLRSMCHPFAWDSSGEYDLDLPPEAPDADPKPRYRYAIAHNGRLPYPSGPKESDTCAFVREVLGPTLAADPYFLTRPAQRWLVEQSIGVKNKIAAMIYDAEEDDLRITFAHRKEGITAHNCWFSNYTYLERHNVTSYPDELGEEGDTYGPHARTYIRNPGVDYRSAAYDEFRKVDKDGWRWSFRRDGWENVDTGGFCTVLSTRPKRPDYYEARVDRELAERKERNLNKGRLRTLFDSTCHLSKTERSDLFRISVAWSRDMFGSSGWTPGVDAVAALRAEVRMMFPEMIGNGEVDRWILSVDKAGRHMRTTLAFVAADRVQGKRFAATTYAVSYDSLIPRRSLPPEPTHVDDKTRVPLPDEQVDAAALVDPALHPGNAEV